MIRATRFTAALAALPRAMFCSRESRTEVINKRTRPSRYDWSRMFSTAADLDLLEDVLHPEFRGRGISAFPLGGLGGHLIGGTLYPLAPGVRGSGGRAGGVFKIVRFFGGKKLECASAGRGNEVNIVEITNFFKPPDLGHRKNAFAAFPGPEDAINFNRFYTNRSGVSALLVCVGNSQPMRDLSRRKPRSFFLSPVRLLLPYQRRMTRKDQLKEIPYPVGLGESAEDKRHYALALAIAEHWQTMPKTRTEAEAMIPSLPAALS